MPTLLLPLALSGCFFGPNEFEGDTPGECTDGADNEAVSHSGPAVSMPLGASTPLPNDEIGHIERWINAGAAL